MCWGTNRVNPSFVNLNMCLHLLSVKNEPYEFTFWLNILQKKKKNLNVQILWIQNQKKLQYLVFNKIDFCFLWKNKSYGLSFKDFHKFKSLVWVLSRKKNTKLTKSHLRKILQLYYLQNLLNLKLLQNDTHYTRIPCIHKLINLSNSVRKFTF